MMRWGGVALLLFVAFHLLHLTTHTINVNGDPESPYERVVSSFQPEQWWVSVVYLLAMIALAMHMRHGVWRARYWQSVVSGKRVSVRVYLWGSSLNKKKNHK